MEIIEKSYSGKHFKPAPKVYQSQDQELMSIITTWGEGVQRESIHTELSKFIFAAQGDFEVTTPFEFNTALSKDSNSLRMAALISNDYLYRAENKDDIRTCYEILILFKNKNTLSWLQIGNPNVILVRNNLIPISFSTGTDSKSFNSLILPNQFYGIDMHCHFQVGSIELLEGDKILLCNNSILSPENWGLNNKSGLDVFFKNQIKFNSEIPFWMGMINL